MMHKKVVITGTSGFIGSHILDCFVNNGITPHCIVRNKNKMPHLKNVPVLLGDITDHKAMETALKGAEFVIHIGGMSIDWGKKEAFTDINVNGTINILKACVVNGIKDVIITGSISSYGEDNSLLVKNEDSPYNSHYKYFLDVIFPSAMNHYRDTKAEATRKAIDFAHQNNLNITIIEPVWVYGPREFNTGFYEYMKTVKDGMPLLFGSRNNKFPVIYAPDLARCYLLAYQKKLQGINRIIAGNSENVKMDTIYSMFCREIGKKKPGNLPRFLIYPIGFILELIYTLFGSSSPPILTRSRVNMFYDNIETDTRKAERLLGFKNEFTLEEGIKNTVKWYKENEYI